MEKVTEMSKILAKLRTTVHVTATEHWVTWKNRSDLVLWPNRLSDYQITRSDRRSD